MDNNVVTQEETSIVKEFKDYYFQRVSEIIKHFIRASKNGDENAIHDLRVEIKKIRAFLELIKGITPYFDLKRAYQPIKNLFKTAAPIRDAQVLQTMTIEYIKEVGLDVNLSEYFNILKQREMVGKKEFFKFSKKFDISIFDEIWSDIEKSIVGIKSNLENKQNQENIQFNYIQSLFNILNSIKNSNNLKEQDFHEIRILCKKIRYTLEILYTLFSQESFEYFNSNLKMIHQPLGEWHDTDAAILLINNILSDQSLKPLFSESSYNDMLQSFNVKKQHFNDLFIEHFNKLNLAV